MIIISTKSSAAYYKYLLIGEKNRIDDILPRREREIRAIAALGSSLLI